MLVLLSNQIIAHADNYESNDTKATATTLTLSNMTAYSISYIGVSGDVDWYKINLTTTGEYSIALTNNITGSTGSSPYSSLPANYNVALYRSTDSSARMISAASGTTPEILHFTVTSSNAGWFYVKIYGATSSAYNATRSYKLVLQLGDTEMFREGSRYRDYCGYSWFCRSSASDTAGTELIQGVAYSYGNKDSLSYFNSQLSTAITNASTPLDAWSDYSSSYKRLGLFQSEYNSNNNLIFSFIGIDCNGFVQRALQASSLSYTLVDDYELTSTNGFGGEASIGTITSSSYATQISSSSIPGALKTGVVVKKYDNTHIFFISRANLNSTSGCYLMGAEADSASNGYRRVQEDSLSKYSSGIAYYTMNN